VAIQPGQAQVQHQRIVVVLLQGPVGQPAVVHPLDLDARMLQRPAQPGAQMVVVFSQKDAHGGMLLFVRRSAFLPDARFSAVRLRQQRACENTLPMPGSRARAAPPHWLRPPSRLA